MRLDKYLFDNNYFDSRRKAQDAIKDGLVSINGKVITKSSFDYTEGNITIKESEISFVSRGGFKLLQAIEKFNLDFNDKVILDIGASTGGFTDCSLKHGAKQIYATDVGTSQLVTSLKEDPRVKSIENLNFREAKPFNFDEKTFDYVVIDVSFISLEHIFGNLDLFVNDKSFVVALIKPQFELGDISIQNKGIISRKEDHLLAINLVETRANKYGFYLNKLTFSPIVGEKKGNIEFIGLFSKKNLGKLEKSVYFKVVEEAHKVLKGGR